MPLSFSLPLLCSWLQALALLTFSSVALASPAVINVPTAFGDIDQAAVSELTNMLNTMPDNRQLIAAAFMRLDFPNSLMFTDPLCLQMHPNDPGQQLGIRTSFLLISPTDYPINVSQLHLQVTYRGDDTPGCENFTSPGFSPETVNLCQSRVHLGTVDAVSPDPLKPLFTLEGHSAIVYSTVVCLSSKDVAFTFLLPWIKSGGYINRKFYSDLNTTACNQSANPLYPYSLDGSRKTPILLSMNGTMSFGLREFIPETHAPGALSITGPGCNF